MHLSLRILQDIPCAVQFAAQITEEKICIDKIKSLKMVIKHPRCTPHLHFCYPKLDTFSLRLKVCSDSSFANIPDLKRLGYTILLAEEMIIVILLRNQVAKALV